MNETNLDETKITKNYEIISNTVGKNNLFWKDEHEKILVEWADKAMCYRWLHSKAHQRYSVFNMWFTIPVIIMSTLTGTANFAQDKFPDDKKDLVQVIIGSVNILAGIITTIAQFLKIGELNESHRVSSISWDKFYRNIKVELSKSRDERMNVIHMLKICKEEFDRLMETSPAINDHVINLFTKTFSSTKSDIIKNSKDKKYELFSLISKPEICDELISTNTVIFKQNTEEDEDKIKENQMIEMAKKNKIEIDKFETEVKDFINQFNSIHNRLPLNNEIIDNLSDKIDKNILNKILNRLETLNMFENV
jgi:hypothetical protein